jgi:hypothetical protein
MEIWVYLMGLLFPLSLSLSLSLRDIDEIIAV